MIYSSLMRFWNDCLHVRRGVSLSQPTVGSKDLPARQLRGSRTGHHEDTEDGNDDFISNSAKKSGQVKPFFFAFASAMHAHL